VQITLRRTIVVALLLLLLLSGLLVALLATLSWLLLLLTRLLILLAALVLLLAALVWIAHMLTSIVEVELEVTWAVQTGSIGCDEKRDHAGTESGGNGPILLLGRWALRGPLCCTQESAAVRRKRPTK
jgi:hypothetical protein